jgi:hypothetical protein
MRVMALVRGRMLAGVLRRRSMLTMLFVLRVRHRCRLGLDGLFLRRQSGVGDGREDRLLSLRGRGVIRADDNRGLGHCATRSQQTREARAEENESTHLAPQHALSLNDRAA